MFSYQRYRISTFLVLTVALLTCSTQGLAQDSSTEVLFEEDFSNPVNGNPNPVWSWNVEEGAREGMMLGSGDIYERAYDEKFLSHKYALQLNFAGRNGFCNSCGGQYIEVTSLEEGVACASTDSTDAHEGFIYNLSNNFSVWEIKEALSSPERICFATTSAQKPAINNKTSTVSLGDKIFLPNLCGVSGVVGRDVDRKSDCNKAVNYLSSVGSDDFPYGSTLSRRFYFYIDKNAVMPDITFKLAYSFWQRPGENVRGSELNISVQRDLSFSLLTPDGNRVTLSSPEHIHFNKGQWYYVEEVFKRESAPGVEDATYSLYAAPSGEEHGIDPVLEVKGFEIGDLRRMSIGGNWQHYEDVAGHVYFDNIKILKGGRAGPVARIDFSN